MKRICIWTIILAVSSASVFAQQTSQAPASTPVVEQKSHTLLSAKELEKFNVRETNAVGYQPFTDSILGVNNPVRQALARHGFGLAFAPAFIINATLPDASVPWQQQSYVGQRPTYNNWEFPTLTYDMRALHVPNAQIVLVGGVQRVNWAPSGPNATRIIDIIYDQRFWKDHAIIRGGYMTNNTEFTGVQVGGVLTSGALGVYARIPNVVGGSHNPVNSPQITLTLRANNSMYTKIGYSRSLSPSGATKDIVHDSFGLRFGVKGEKLIQWYEGGYKRAATPTNKQTWVRFGYIHNATPYTNYTTSKPTDGNYGIYLLGDRQLTQPDATKPFRGLYGGFSSQYAPPDRNTYTQNYNVRLYWRGPFAKRLLDMASITADHSDYSEFRTRALVKTGNSVWNSTTSYSGSYSARLRPGVYFAPGVSYTYGPAVTPRVGSAFVIIGQLYTNF